MDRKGFLRAAAGAAAALGLARGGTVSAERVLEAPARTQCRRCGGDEGQVVYEPAELERVDLGAFRARKGVRFDILSYVQGGYQAFGGPCPVCRGEDFLGAFPKVPTAADHHEAYTHFTSRGVIPTEARDVFEAHMKAHIKLMREQFALENHRIMRGRY